MPTSSERLQRLNELTSVPANRIRGDVPQSLHPDMLLPEGENLIDDDSGIGGIDAYTAGRGAMREMLESLTNITDAVREHTIQRPVPNQIVAPGNKPVLQKVVDPARALEVRDGMAISAKRVAQAYEKSIAVFDAKLTRAEEAVASKLRDPRADSTVSQDIRRFVFSLPANERRAWVEGRIQEGDLTVSHAVLGASPYASGLDPKGTNLLRDLAARTFAPAEVRAHQNLQSAKRKVDVAFHTWGKEYVKKLPAAPSDAPALKKLKGAA
ncbi:MAG: hypothetical protein K2Y71_29230 [Xanthobacteraceae bacterium]|nr:hypothetical protein [Xanthobacteraceae bacterium]